MRAAGPLQCLMSNPSGIAQPPALLLADTVGPIACLAAGIALDTCKFTALIFTHSQLAPSMLCTLGSTLPCSGSFCSAVRLRAKTHSAGMRSMLQRFGLLRRPLWCALLRGEGVHNCE